MFKAISVENELGRNSIESNGRTLANEKPNAYPREVKSIQPSLNIQSNVLCVLTTLPFKDSLCDGRYCWIVTGLDVSEKLCEPLVKVLNFWGPIDIGGVSVISSGSKIEENWL